MQSDRQLAKILANTHVQYRGIDYLEILSGDGIIFE